MNNVQRKSKNKEIAKQKQRHGLQRLYQRDLTIEVSLDTSERFDNRGISGYIREI